MVILRTTSILGGQKNDSRVIYNITYLLKFISNQRRLLVRAKLDRILDRLLGVIFRVQVVAFLAYSPKRKG